MDIVSESKNLYQNQNSALTDRVQFVINELEENSRVLEIGVGWGEFTKNVGRFKKIQLSAVDVAERALKDVQGYLENSELVDISNQRMNYPDDYFDVVICLEVFEHLQNPYLALTEIQRVLKPRGKLILSIPNYRGGHLMIYPGLMTPKFFGLFLRQNFFKITKFHSWGFVLNKDNIGELIKIRIRDPFLSLWLLRFFQITVRTLQFLAKLVFLKVPQLYWCYFFICENKKDKMDKPFWLRQLEQTSELGKDKKGWYHHYYHQKA